MSDRIVGATPCFLRSSRRGHQRRPCGSALGLNQHADQNGQLLGVFPAITPGRLLGVNGALVASEILDAELADVFGKHGTLDVGPLELRHLRELGIHVHALEQERIALTVLGERKPKQLAAALIDAFR